MELINLYQLLVLSNIKKNKQHPFKNKETYGKTHKKLKKNSIKKIMNVNNENHESFIYIWGN